MNYYNDSNPKIKPFVERLIAAKLVPDGVFDERSICDVSPSDLKGFTQCHFFCGILGWSLALNLARWPSNEPVWTGSCPCQPFSVNGKGLGKDDDRHLWPTWFNLIKECKPSVVFGEQVANAITKGWLDEVSHDLEAQGYAIGSAVLPACSVGAPHRRDRLWFVASDNEHNGVRRSSEEPVQGVEGFSWNKDVRGLEDLRGRSYLPEPIVCKLGNGVWDCVAELHAFGNAIVPQVASEFVMAFNEATNEI